jgi:putative transposase
VTADLRLVLNTIFYLAKAGCQWAMLPTSLAKRSTAHDYLSRWKADGTWQAIQDALRRAIRTAAGREPEPSKAAIDSQTAKGSEAGGPRGYDGGKKVNGRKRHPGGRRCSGPPSRNGGKKVNGRKRHLVVDSMGLLLVVLVTAANLDDGTHAPNVLARLTAAHLSRLDEVRGGLEVQQPDPGPIPAGVGGPVQGDGGGTPARGHGIGAAPVPVGSRADERLDGEVPAEQ